MCGKLAQKLDLFSNKLLGYVYSPTHFWYLLKFKNRFHDLSLSADVCITTPRTVEFGFNLQAVATVFQKHCWVSMLK
jgi:hypothetical protein